MLESARVRKLIGLFALLAFMMAYIALVATIGDYVPRHWAAQLIYYVAAGVLWGVPVLPLFRWMNSGR
jgi:nitrate reductase NapE component